MKKSKATPVHPTALHVPFTFKFNAEFAISKMEGAQSKLEPARLRLANLNHFVHKYSDTANILFFLSLSFSFFSYFRRFFPHPLSFSLSLHTRRQPNQ